MSKKRGVRGGSPGEIGAASGRVQAADKVSTGVAGLRDAAMWALLYLAALAAYWPSLHGDMLWDDGSHITSLRLQSLQGLGRIWFEPGATQQYYPLLHSAFWIEHLLWGDSLLGYHLVNVTLHAASAGLVVTIVRRLSLPGSWLAGFIFALHPVCVEAVAWISEQKSTLSGVFCLAAALTWLHFDQKRRISLYIAATGLFIMALPTKSVTATLPASLLILFWWQRGRIDFRRDVAPLLPWFALGASMGLFTAWVERTYIGAKGAGFDDISPLQRLLLAGRVPWFYAGKVLWPVNLTFSYPRWQVDAAQWWQYLYPAGLVAALGMAIFWVERSPRSRKSRAPLASFLIFIVTLFPVLGFLNVYPFRYSYVADHFQYLATLAIIVPASYLLNAAAARWLPGKAIATAVPAALLVMLGALTWRQSHNYSDSETLYRATLANNPDSWLAHINLGRILHVQPGRLQDAIAEYEAAVRINPDRAEAWTDLGDALALTPGRTTDAIAAEKTALRLQPGLVAAHANLGKILAQMPGRMPEALAEFETAIRLDPDQPEMHYNLGTAFMNTPGRLPDAIAEFRTAIGIDPDYAEAHYNLAACLSRMPGRESDAIAEFEATLRIRPDFEPAQAALQRMRAAGR